MQGLECVGAEEILKNEIELYLQTILVDIVAYYAEQIEVDPMDGDNLAQGYVMATALYPLMQSVQDSASAADIIKENMGVFGSEEPLKDGKDVVIGALKTFVTAQGIDCSLLTRNVCGESNILQDNVGGGAPSSSLLSDYYTPTSNVDHM